MNSNNFFTKLKINKNKAKYSSPRHLYKSKSKSNKINRWFIKRIQTPTTVNIIVDELDKVKQINSTDSYSSYDSTDILL